MESRCTKLCKTYFVLSCNGVFFFQLAKTLKEGQYLNKCPLCNYAAIVDQNISQCQKDLCGYICCLSCQSFSKTGPENFVDKCQGAKLLFEKPKSKPRLTDSPEKDNNNSDLPSFLLDDSFGTPKFNSSAFMETPISADSSKVCDSSHRRSIILQDCNRDLSEPKVYNKRRSSLAAVVSLNKSKEEDLEPSSPPKVKNVAFSKQSKRNLKRLLR